MIRSPLRRDSGEARLTVRLPECRHCGKPFVQFSSTQAVCGPRCALAELRAKEKAAKKAERELTKARREALMSHGDWLLKVRDAFNAYIRARDEGKLCICCRKPMQPQRYGGSVDAGHYLSVGSAPNLRFDETNVNAQRKSCNQPGGTTRASFRAGMIERYGLAAVEALEADQAPRKYAIADLKAMVVEYRAKARAFRKASCN